MTTVPQIEYDQIFNRLIAQLPPWFLLNPQFVPLPTAGIKNPSPLFNNILWMFLITAFDAYNLLHYDWLQMRIGLYEILNDPDYNFGNAPTNFPYTQYPIAYQENLDLISQDFYGNNLLRRPFETDNSFRSRILSNLLRPKATRPAMLSALINLLYPAFEGSHLKFIPPVIYEGWQVSDTGVLNWDNPPTMAMNVLGGLGTLSGVGGEPYTCIIKIFLPHGNGMATYLGVSTFDDEDEVMWGAGVGTQGGTYPPQWLGTYDFLNFYVTESDVRHLVELTKVYGTYCHLIFIYV